MGKQYKSFAAELDVVYKKTEKIRKRKITCSTDVYMDSLKIWPVDVNHREAFVVMFLNRANNTVGYATISTGGLSGTVADAKVIYQYALLCNASAIICLHNHPSGNLQPSKDDIELTKRIKEIGSLLECPMLDHLIITETNYYSFADEGML
jgi:DNA repair protein RadC